MLRVYVWKEGEGARARACVCVCVCLSVSVRACACFVSWGLVGTFSYYSGKSDWIRPHGLSFTGWGVAVYVSDRNQPKLPTPFYSVLVSVSVYMALSTVFHSINSPDNSLLSHSVLPVLFLPYWSFQL